MSLCAWLTETVYCWQVFVFSLFEMFRFCVYVVLEFECYSIRNSQKRNNMFRHLCISWARIATYGCGIHVAYKWLRAAAWTNSTHVVCLSFKSLESRSCAGRQTALAQVARPLLAGRFTIASKHGNLGHHLQVGWQGPRVSHGLLEQTDRCILDESDTILHQHAVLRTHVCPKWTMCVRPD